MLAQYQSEYASKKSELEKKLEGIRQQAKDRADHLLQRDKQGASLFAQKQSIETRINERGYQLVESDPVGNELLTKGQKLQEELSTLDKKGLVSSLLSIKPLPAKVANLTLIITGRHLQMGGSGSGQPADAG